MQKLESQLDKLLKHPTVTTSDCHQVKSVDTLQTNSVESTNSVLSDTRTVMKLLQTVKRVVSKLKMEIHQDFLEVGNINVGLLRTLSMESFKSEHQVQSMQTRIKKGFSEDD